MVVGMALPTLVTHEIASLRTVLTTALSMGDHASVSTDMTMLGSAARHVFFVLLGLGAGVMLIGVGSALLQGGFFLATKAVKPKWSKLNLLTGLKRIFGPHALWEGAKMLMKTSFVALIVYIGIRAMMPLLGGLLPMSTVVNQVSSSALGLIRNVCMVGIGLAAVDYLFQRRRIGKQVRMTKEEVRQEHKQAEGDPMVKSAIRSRQLAAARNRMMADVKTADVVMVNPTHYAVALRYDAERGAPRVVARGAGAIAAKIRALAAVDDVPLVRDIPLTRALYRSCQVGQEIPPELFAAVAQVLAFVINRRTRGRRGGEHRSPRREGELPPVPARGRRRRTPTQKPSTAALAGR
jgi:flagellar biosynthetic protein FlhB